MIQESTLSEAILVSIVIALSCFLYDFTLAKIIVGIIVACEVGYAALILSKHLGLTKTIVPGKSHLKIIPIPQIIYYPLYIGIWYYFGFYKTTILFGVSMAIYYAHWKANKK